MRLRSITVAGLLTLGALSVPAVAYASTGHVELSKPCTKAGETVTKHGDDYICQRKPGDACLQWHHLPQKHAGPRWSPKPCNCSPSPSHTTPSATTSLTAIPTTRLTAIPTTPAPTATGQGETPTATPAGGADTTGTLPVTGPKQDVANAAVKAGGWSLLIGLALYGLSFLRRRRTT